MSAWQGPAREEDLVVWSGAKRLLAECWVTTGGGSGQASGSLSPVAAAEPGVAVLRDLPLTTRAGGSHQAREKDQVN